MNNYKLGSLFDGSGGFPLAGTLCGIEPVWAAEVEPYPIAVTRSRFPRMRHLGDISKVNGAEIEPVDIITFGSPCQDLSVAGKRAGLKHEANGDEETTRSGLFMEAVRIIKEMRNATNGKYPTYALWENVPGAFSSNKGEDFRIVCEELIKIVEPTATMPEVPQKGWNYSDSYIGDGWSLAYRVLDAQYWGVPQRRRRIYLVADFRGQRAREVLFEREGLRGYFTQGRTPWQTTPSDAERSLGADDREGEGFDGGDRGRQLDDVAYTLKIRSGCEGGGKGALVQEEKSATLATNNDQYLFQPMNPTFIVDNIGGQAEYGKVTHVNGTLRSGCQGAIGYVVENHPAPKMFENHSQDTRYKGPLDVAQTVSATYGMGGNNQPFVVEQTPFCKSARGKFKGDAETWKDGKVANTLNTFDQGETRANELVVQGVINLNKGDVQSKAVLDPRGIAPSLYAGECRGGGGECYVLDEKPVICLQGNGIDRADTAGCNGKGWKEDKSYTLNTIDRPAVAYGLDRASFNQGQHAKFDFTVTEESQPTIVARGPGAVAQPIYNASKASFFMRATENGSADTLVATDYKDPQLVAYGIDPGASRDVGDLFIEEQSKTLTNGSCPGHHNGVVIAEKPHYIVRRLTPTECARLQGFADRWGDIEALDRMSAKDYQFWKEVRNTHAAINGKKEQDYTVKQMLTWYNKLQTDSSEYKMWGNGIALPTALYVLQGIAEALDADDYSTQLTMSAVEDDDDSWME